MDGGMEGNVKAGEYGPLTRIGSFPVYVSTVLVGLHVVMLVITAIAMSPYAGGGSLLAPLMFSTKGFLFGFRLWQPLTYAFINPPMNQPWLMLLISLYMLGVFGPEIENYLGRWVFLRIYVGLLLLPPVVLSIPGLLGFSAHLTGSSILHFAIFIVFVMLYPRAEIFFGIQARWVAAALFGLSVLQDIAMNNLTDLLVLTADCAAACGIVLLIRRGLPTPIEALQAWITSLRHRPKLSIVPKEDQMSPTESIDPILEKISRSGMASLTSQERARLQKAREALLAKDKTHP